MASRLHEYFQFLALSACFKAALQVPAEACLVLAYLFAKRKQSAAEGADWHKLRWNIACICIVRKLRDVYAGKENTWVSGFSISVSAAEWSEYVEFHRHMLTDIGGGRRGVVSAAAAGQDGSVKNGNRHGNQVGGRQTRHRRVRPGSAIAARAHDKFQNIPSALFIFAFL